MLAIYVVAVFWLGIGLGLLKGKGERDLQFLRGYIQGRAEVLKEVEMKKS
jgi:hypothetical protein